MTEAASAARCPVVVLDKSYERKVCGAPVKRDGLCGRHAAYEERRPAHLRGLRAKAGSLGGEQS